MKKKQTGSAEYAVKLYKYPYFWEISSPNKMEYFALVEHCRPAIVITFRFKVYTTTNVGRPGPKSLETAALSGVNH